jgi:hypothetical protein
MNKILKISMYSVILIFALFGAIFLAIEIPKENNIFDKSAIWIRFNLFPGRYYYSDRYYYSGRHYYPARYYNSYQRYAKVDVEVYDKKNEHVEEVYFNNHLVVSDSYNRFSRYSTFLLAPGVHDISWTVNKKGLFSSEKTYHKKIRIQPYQGYQRITIEGNKIYIE